MSENTIIIKRIKKGGHGHHGGAWKVAYADFVTAMMVFFLLLWLLASVPQETLDGLGDFFKPTEATEKSASSSDENLAIAMKSQLIEEMEISNQDLESIIENKISKTLNDKYGNIIKIAQDSDGIIIIIESTAKEKLFEDKKYILSPNGQEKLNDIAQLIKPLPYYLSISGHIDSSEIDKYTKDAKWKISLERSNAARKALIQNGIPDEKIAQLMGKADFQHIDIKNPKSYRNRRIQIKLLNKDNIHNNKKNVVGNILEKK